MKKIMFNDMYGLTDAVLNGRKTMTRRVITVPDKWHGLEVYGFSHVKGEHTLTLTDGDDFIIEDPNTGEIGTILPTYKIGEVLAVAQNYRKVYEHLKQTYGSSSRITKDFYFEHVFGGRVPVSNKMYVRADLMPNKIRITNIQVERLQDISDKDCLKEGVQQEGYGYYIRGKSDIIGLSAKSVFEILIDKVSGKGTWKRNPMVFAYQFELVSDTKRGTLHK